MIYSARLALVAAGAVAAACAGRQLPPEGNAPPGQLLFNGRARSDVNCFKCHDGDGSGTARGPDLGRVVPGMTDAQIIGAIDKGPGLMPSFEEKLSPTEKQQLVEWLRERFPASVVR